MDKTDATTAELKAECPLTPDQQGTVRIVFFRALGLMCVALAVLGAFLPLLPTTVFFIAAVWCFAKSAPAWRQRILDHPRYGPPVRRFSEYGIIPRRVKLVAIAVIAANFTLSVLFVAMGPLTLVILAMGLLAVSAYIATRPEAIAAPTET